jgi:hypothetical protein
MLSADKLLSLLAGRYNNGGAGLNLPLSRRTGGRNAASDGSDKDADPSSSLAHSEDDGGIVHVGSVVKEKKSTTVSRLEASLRRKGNRFSQLSHKFRDMVTDKLHMTSRKDATAGEPSSSSSAAGSKNGSGNNSLNKEQALALTHTISSPSSAVSEQTDGESKGENRTTCKVRLRQWKTQQL